VLGVEDLSISFGGLAALSGLSFEVRDREIFALIGPNGAGKSTVFNVITGLYRPSGGRITLGGDDLLALAPHQIARRGVARTFQNTEVFRQLTALDNVLIGRHAHLRTGVIRGALGLPFVWREEARARELDRPLIVSTWMPKPACRREFFCGSLSLPQAYRRLAPVRSAG